jgi:hypothetical protein
VDDLADPNEGAFVGLATDGNQPTDKFVRNELKPEKILGPDSRRYDMNKSNVYCLRTESPSLQRRAKKNGDNVCVSAMV